MFRSTKTLATVAIIATLFTTAAFVSPSQALAGPPPHKPHVVLVNHVYHNDYIHVGLYGPHYGFHYGVQPVYVGPTVISPPVLLAAPVVVSTTPHTLYYLGPNGQMLVYGTFTQTIFSNGATQMGGLLQAQSSLNAAGISNWIDTPPSAVAGSSAS